MHKSSSLTLFLKYFYLIVFGLPLALSIFDSDQNITSLLGNSILIIIAGILYHFTLGKLRYLNAKHETIVTHTLNYEEIIRYEEIEYVYQIALWSPIMIGIKYRDEDSGQEKTFYTLACFRDQLFSFNFLSMNEVDLTDFIRKKVKAVKPSYDENNEPSRWAPFLYFISSIFLFILLSNLITL